MWALVGCCLMLAQQLPAGFSGVALVASKGVVISETAAGFANRSTRTPITSDTRFQLASGDKLFTKIAISQLAAAGKLSLTDTVGKFLPDYPNETVRRKVTIEHLLLHRSGLGAFWNADFEKRRNQLRTVSDYVSLFANEAPAFNPGERMQYSNNGYVLLGRIIEVLSGLSYYDYVQKNIFTPAGMTNTAYLTNDSWPRDKAVGYTVRDSASGAVVENTNTLAYRGTSAGGGYSTARDLMKLDAALRRGEIGNPAVMNRITMRSPSGRVVLANGGGPGANVEISRVGDTTYIILANLDPPAATRVLEKMIGTAPAPQQQPDLRAEVVKLNEAMMEAFKTDPATVAAFYADDAKILGPGPSAEGRAAIDRYWKMFPAGSFTWKLDVIEVSGTRNMVSQFGKSTLTGSMGAQAVDFVVIWKRQPSGQLKIEIDYWMPAR